MTSVQFYDCPVVIPYYGGKFRLSNQLVPMLATHERYIEVFAGGLSMFFRKKKSSYSVINDIDNDEECDEVDYDDGVGIDEVGGSTIKLIRMIDVLGREYKEHKKSVLLFYIYDNGEVKKLMKY